MHLVQILLPLYDNDGRPQPRDSFGRVRRELADQFGGLTAFTRAPAEGLWTEGEGETSRDDIVVFEVMVDDLDAGWWKDYRQSLEALFRQEAIIVRALAIRTL